MTQHHKLLVFLPSWWMLFAADVINHWISCLLIKHKYPHCFTLQCQCKANVGWKRVPVVAGWRKGTFTYNISSGLITSTEELPSLSDGDCIEERPGGHHGSQHISTRLKTEVANWIDWDNYFFISDQHLISDLFLTDGPIFLISIPRR